MYQYRWIQTFVIGAMLWMGTPQLALAQEDDADITKRAKAAFNRGRASFEQQRYADAATAFREAFDIKPAWRLLYNIAQAETAGKRYGLALDAFEKYLALGGDEVPDERKEEVIAEMLKLRAMVGFLEVEARPGAIVFVDNVRRGEAPLPGRLRLTAGIEHTLYVEYELEQIFTQTVKVSGGESITIDTREANAIENDDTPTETGNTVDDDAPVPTASETEPTGFDETQAPSSPLLLRLGIIASATGGAALVGGIVSGAVAVSKNRFLEAECTGTDCSEHPDAVTSLNRAATISTILFPVGGILAATGITLLVFHSKQKRSERVTPVTITPLVSPLAGGIYVQGRF